MPAATIRSITRRRVAWHPWRGPLPPVRHFTGSPTGQAASALPDDRIAGDPLVPPPTAPVPPERAANDRTRAPGDPQAPGARPGNEWIDASVLPLSSPTDPGQGGSGPSGGGEALPPFAGSGTAADGSGLPVTAPSRATDQPADPATARPAHDPERRHSQRLPGPSAGGAGAGLPGAGLFEEPAGGPSFPPLACSFESPAPVPTGPDRDEAAAPPAGTAGVHAAPRPTLAPGRITWESGRACLAAWDRWRRQAARPATGVGAALPLANPSRTR